MVIFTKDDMDTDKPIPVVIIPPMRFIGNPTSKARTRSIHGSWDLEISVSMIQTIGIPVEEALDDIGMKIINVVIHLDCDSEASWVKLLGEI